MVPWSCSGGGTFDGLHQRRGRETWTPQAVRSCAAACAAARCLPGHARRHRGVWGCPGRGGGGAPGESWANLGQLGVIALKGLQSQHGTYWQSWGIFLGKLARRRSALLQRFPAKKTWKSGRISGQPGHVDRATMAAMAAMAACIPCIPSPKSDFWANGCKRQHDFINFHQFHHFSYFSPWKT